MPLRSFALPAVLCLVCLLTARSAEAQPVQHTSASTELFAEIAAMDSVMFSAFNARDLGTLRTLFTRDLEFYHDQTGLTSYEENMTAFKDLFGRDNGLRRDLVPGSLEVYPVEEYGAIEVGKHTFCHGENGQEDCGTFPFVMVWRKDGADWKVSRVISYGH
jgi:hypothetical protein